MKAVTRRALLRGAGGVVVGLPFLELFSGGSRAQAAPKRFVVMFTAAGCVYDRWKPTGSGEAFELSESLAALAPRKSDLVVLGGVSLRSAIQEYNGFNGHDRGMGSMMSSEHIALGPGGLGDNGVVVDGSAGGITIDQTIANAIGQGTLFRSLELGVEANTNPGMPLSQVTSYRGPFQPNYPRNSPEAAFSEVFGAGVGGAEVAKLHVQRRSVLDAVADDYGRLLKRVGADDKARLDAHLTAIRDLETRLEMQDEALVGCDVPDFPSGTSFPKVGEYHTDLLVRSLSCDLTRVGTLQWSTAQSGTTFTWLGHSVFHHQLSHDAGMQASARDKLVEIHNWYSLQLLHLMDAMAAVDEGERTLLENTVILWINEIGNPWDHTYENTPIVLAGQGGGALTTGRFLETNGASHADVFVSLQQLFGVESDVFGNPEFCDGPLPGLL